MNLKILKTIIPFLWPKNNLIFRIRVVAAFLFLIFAKIFTVLIPISLIWIVDSFEFKTSQTSKFFIFFLGTLSFIIIYNVSES